MKRLLVLVVGLLLAVAALPVLPSGGSAAAAAPETTTITSYVADFDIDSVGDLSATETLTVDFPSGDKHGIYRYFDTYDASAPGTRRVPRHIGVTMDGEGVHFERRTLRRGRYVKIRIGDPDVFVTPGEHVYEISYEIDGVLEEGTNGSVAQFYWNLIGAGWLQRIERSDLAVHLPAAAETLQCFIGAGARERDCRTVRGEGTDTIRVRTRSLRPRTPVTIMVGLDLATTAPGRL